MRPDEVRLVFIAEGVHRLRIFCWCFSRVNYEIKYFKPQFRTSLNLVPKPLVDYKACNLMKVSSRYGSFYEAFIKL